MDLRDQLEADLENVFFSDINDIAVIGGKPIKGYFYNTHHVSDAFQGNAYIFEAPRHIMPKIKKGDLVIRQKDSRQFSVKLIIREDGITKLIL